MEILRNKSKISTIAFVLMLTMSVSLVALPAATAQDTWNTWAICEVVPNPVGVGQEVLVTFGITTAAAHPQPGWYDLTVTVERPDGTTETLGPFTTDTTGMTGTMYVPDQVGTYYFQAHFPEQVVEAQRPGRGVPVGTVMLASDSAVVELIVQEEPIPYFPAAQLPTEYWTHPIDAQNREWYTISGSWLDTSAMRAKNRFAPYNDDAPDSAHILWTKPYAEGGLVGGELGFYSFEAGDAYEGKWPDPIIVAGILISNRHSRGTQEVFAINLRTGEELWSRTLIDNASSSFGQIMYWDTMNMHGAFPYVWATRARGTTWDAYDPFTGRWEYSMTGVPRGTRVYGPNGEIMIYTIDLKNGWMTKWNSTAAYYQWQLYLELPDPEAYYHAGRWRPLGKTFDASFGFDWNVTIPMDLPGAVEVIIEGDRIIGSNTDWAGGNQQPNPVFWAINIAPGYEGQLIFNKTWPLPTENLWVDFTGSHPYSVEDGVFVVSAKETRKYYGLSLDTGEQLWGPTTWDEPVMGAFTMLYMDPWGQAVSAYGKLYTAGMGGQVNAYDITTGEHLWSYDIADPYNEQLFSNNWPAPVGFITDGKIYMFHMEHSVINPMPRGAPAVCLDAETGEEIWRIDGLRLGTRWGGQPIIGDSIIAAFSSYDNNIVAIGKGPSSTTVSAAPKVVAKGTSVVIEGTVMDESPGTKEPALTARFPNGVPAIADESMSEWMLYVYKQFPIPADVTGVEVVIDAVDPNGNYINIGTTTSDMSGLFSYLWTPETEGKYTIYATFLGSKSYYGSYAETGLGVGPEPTPYPEYPEPAEAPVYTTIDLVIIVAVAVAIVIGIVNLYALRKQRK